MKKENILSSQNAQTQWTWLLGLSCAAPALNVPRTACTEAEGALFVFRGQN